MNDSIFKPCDIRGIYPEQFDAEAATLIGSAIGTEIGGEPVVIGGDVRVSTPELKAALVDGLTSCGCPVTDVGIVPTPLLYFAKRHLGLSHAVMVTASHNPPEYNGVKFVINHEPTGPEIMSRLRQHILAREFIRGDGSAESRCVTDAYRNWLCERCADPALSSVTILIDAGNGAASPVAPGIMRVAGLNVVEMSCDPDGRFPSRSPDPAVLAHLTATSDRVREAGVDFGAAFDGDGDRVIFLDEHGRPLAPDRVGVLLARHMLRQAPGGAVVYDLKCSNQFPLQIERAGGRPVMERSGHSFIRRRMRADGAVFGVEVSGHIFFGELDGADDSLLATLLLARILSDSGTPLSQLMSTVPETVITPDIRIPVVAESRTEIMDRFAAAFGHLPTETLDGVRVSWQHGWALCRASVTEPAMTFRIEADTAADLASILAEIGDALPEIRDDLFSKAGAS